MNEQLQKALAEILALLTESAKTVGATAQQEIPLLVREYLWWGIADGLLWMALTVAIGVACLRLGKRIESFDSYVDEDAAMFFSRYALPAAGWAFIIIGSIVNLYQVLQVAISPRVYLMNKVLGLVR